jgi:hypothetical protein
VLKPFQNLLSTLLGVHANTSSNVNATACDGAIGGPTVTSWRMSPDHKILSFDAVGGLADCTFVLADYETFFLSVEERSSCH